MSIKLIINKSEIKNQLNICLSKSAELSSVRRIDGPSSAYNIVRHTAGSRKTHATGEEAAVAGGLSASCASGYLSYGCGGNRS